MEPWSLADRLTAASSVDQERILAEIPQNDPFWVGASYAVDPFVGAIYKLPLSDPHRYERGLSPDMFDRVVRGILAHELRGDRLAAAIEAVSKACTHDQWSKWYRPILAGTLDLQVPVALFNKYAPNPIAPPALSKPKPLLPAMERPTGEFFLQPAYDNHCFWLLDSKTALIEVRGYTDTGVRLHDPQIEKALFDLGQHKPVDLVIFGSIGDRLVIDDLVTREQFSAESSDVMLRQRLAAADRLGLPMAQRSDVLTAFDARFFKELGLIFEQGFRAALLRDFNAIYPFRVQADYKLSAKSWKNANTSAADPI